MRTTLSKIITPTSILIGVLLWLSQCSLAAQQNLVQNYSFENGWHNGPTNWGWTYNVGLALGFPNAADGRDWVDIYGTLYQTIQTTPGQEYQLQFALSGNFNISTPTVIDALWNGVSLGTVSWSPAGHSITNLGWVWTDFNVTAGTTTSLLTFANPFVGDGSGRIPNLDAVSVEPVPEPASVWLLCFGILAFLRPDKPQEPTAVGAFRSAVAVHVAGKTWLSFFREADSHLILRIFMTVAKFVVVMFVMTIVCIIVWHNCVTNRLYNCTDPHWLDFLSPGNWVHGHNGHPVAAVQHIIVARNATNPDTIKAGWSVAGLWHLWYLFVATSFVVSVYVARHGWIPEGQLDTALEPTATVHSASTIHKVIV